MTTVLKKIIVTGGHLSPAIAIVDEIQKRKLPWDVIFIGRTKAFEGAGVQAHERRLSDERHVRFLPLTAGRLQRAFTFHTILSLIKIPVGFIQSFVYVSREKPDCVVSFGGYVAFPVALAAFLLGVPIVTHEQTTAPGLANRIIGRMATRVCITFPQTADLFPAKKTVLTGLPLRQELFKAQTTRAYRDDQRYPLLYITGGSTGAVSMNELLFPIIPDLLDRFTIIHQTGKQSHAKAEKVRMMLSGQKRDRYAIKEFIDVNELGELLRKARLVIARSGANTVTELALFQKRALLIPLPWSAKGEQLKNAQWLATLGLVRIIDQTRAASGAVLSEIDDLLSQPSVTGQKKIEVIEDGAKRMVHEVDVVLKHKSPRYV